MSRNAIVIPAAILATMVGGASAARADAPPVFAGPYAPDYARTIGQHDARTVPFAPSDVHCYSARTGRAYRQVRDRAGFAFVTRSGRPVAGYVTTARAFRSLSRQTVLCAAWRG